MLGYDAVAGCRGHDRPEGRWQHRSQAGAPQRLRVLGVCSLLLALTGGCLKPSLQGEAIEVIHQPALVAHCTLKTEGTYTAVGEHNALTLAKNAAADKGGNVLLILAITKSASFTTEVHGKIYACPRPQ